MRGIPFETFLGRGTASDSAAACAARGGTGSPNAGCAKATAGCAAPAMQGPPGVDRPRRQQGTSPETWKGAEALEEWKLQKILAAMNRSQGKVCIATLIQV